jgi:hypothetical protein
MRVAGCNYRSDPNGRGGTTGAVDESVYTGSADTGSNFRISSCQYIYNLSADALGVGTYRVDIKINDTVVGSVFSSSNRPFAVAPNSSNLQSAVTL